MPIPLLEIGHSVKRLQMRHHRAANEALAELGITIVQWDALRHLNQNPDASLHDLAQLTFQTDQSFGTLAGRMIDRGLVERRPGPGRAVKHRLTDKGEQVRAAGAAMMGGVLMQSFSPLTEAELDVFGALLRRLLRRPEPETTAVAAIR